MGREKSEGECPEGKNKLDMYERKYANQCFCRQEPHWAGQLFYFSGLPVFFLLSLFFAYVFKVQKSNLRQVGYKEMKKLNSLVGCGIDLRVVVYLYTYRRAF